MKRWLVVLVGVAVCYGLLWWQASSSGARAATPGTAVVTAEPGVATADVAQAAAPVLLSEAPSGAGPLHMPDLDHVRTVQVPDCPTMRPFDLSRCDVSTEFNQKCAYQENAGETICSCDGSPERRWHCHDASEEAEATAVPACPSERPAQGSPCDSLTLRCPYDEAQTNCACGDEGKWSCGRRKLPTR